MKDNAAKNPEISGIRILGPDEKIVIQFQGDLSDAQYQAAAEQINALLVKLYVIQERDPSTKKIQIQGGGDK